MSLEEEFTERSILPRYGIYGRESEKWQESQKIKIQKNKPILIFIRTSTITLTVQIKRMMRHFKFQ